MSPAVLFGAAVLCLGAGACGKEAVSPRLSEGFRLDDPERADLTVLEIEGTRFTNSAFARYARPSLGTEESSLTAEAASLLFDDFIDRKLIAHRAKSLNFALTEEEKSKVMERLKRDAGDEARDASQAGFDPEDFFESLLVEKYLISQVRDVLVPDGEITAHYEQHKGDYLQPERLQVSQILTAEEGKASAILDRLQSAGEKEFREIARTESAGPEASAGGVMGVFSLGQLPLELEKVIFSLPEGRISRVVQSDYGYHIFRLDKKFEARLRPPEEAAPLIKAKLLEGKRQAVIDAHVASLRNSESWTIFPENLPFIYQRTTP